MATTNQFFASIARTAMVLKVAEQRMTFLSLSASSSPAGLRAPIPFLCGRGDKRTRRGKIFKGSYGNWRPKKEKKIERIKDRVEVPRSTPWPLLFKLI